MRFMRRKYTGGWSHADPSYAAAYIALHTPNRFTGDERERTGWKRKMKGRKWSGKNDI